MKGKSKRRPLSRLKIMDRGFFVLWPLVLLLLLIITAWGCNPFRALRLASVGAILEDVAKASAKSSEVEIVMEGSAAYILLIDGLLEEAPENRQLLVAAAQAYSSYAAAFLEGKDPGRARRLYLRAREYALRALSHRKGFIQYVSKPYEEFVPYLKEMEKSDVPALFWAASSWAGWISLMGQSVAPLADRPKVVAMVERVLELDEGFNYGGAHLFMGVYYSARPKAYGGDPARAKKHFEKAFAIGDGKYLMAYLLYARYYARQIFNRELFLTSLKVVIDSPADEVPELTLLNTIAKRRAKDLISKAEDYF
jgi:hypothetical protein